MRNSRKIIVAAKALVLIDHLQTKLAAIEMDHEVRILDSIKESVMREIARLSGHTDYSEGEEIIVTG